ncbi:septum site-determining protein MinD [Photobacterium kishitanii]|uniref:Septum site-determining protein MinD n=1 Tax=Photobacterium kishitanii TaxID=318456 RepID=A0A2T3KN87_9GAMM|nr:septum site-determining protein MinD [Photobacterium kishitanii]PSV01205.1 septum site-determining protein MinD [Photobacterium kishitanii]
MKSRVIVTTSGKGGVGKTTTSAAIGYALAKMGHKTIVIDFDIGLRNLDLICGLERRVVYDIISVTTKQASLRQAIVKDKRDKNSNFYILAASQTHDKDALEKEAVGELIQNLKDMGFEFIICDSPAGIESGAMNAFYFADEAIVVTNPEVSSVRDSDRIMGLLDSKTKAAQEDGKSVDVHLLITRYDKKLVKEGSMLAIESICEILGEDDPIGVIPNDDIVREMSNTGNPVTVGKDRVSNAYFNVARKLLGEDIVEEEEGLLKRIFRWK